VRKLLIIGSCLIVAGLVSTFQEAAAVGNDVGAAVKAYRRGDYQAAAAILLPLARQGNVVAQFNIGLLYKKGLGVPKNYGLAAQWYRRAADSGYAAAQNELGLLYGYGLGVPLDYRKSIYWLRRAARQGHMKGQNNLARRYYLGVGVKKDLVKAYMWVLLSARQGEPQAKKGLTFLRRRLTPAQIRQAEQMAARFKPRRER
jgi:TPR repeat protein